MEHGKPWDAQLAFKLIYPLRDTRVSPNQLTTVRMFVGILACLCLSAGGYFWMNIGTLCFALSNFLDHTDGELARLTGKMSKVGHYYDLASDALVNILLFVGIGIGLSNSALGNYAPLMGILAGVSVAAIFQMRLVIENAIGKADARQPHFAGFEAEDVLYILPLISLFDQLVPFLILASIGAPLFGLWVLKEFIALKKQS